MKLMHDSQTQNSNGNWLKSYWDLLIIAVAILYFIIRLIYFATHINPAIPPDEVAHMGISMAYSRVLSIPQNGPETYEFGLVTHQPFLYYWVMGKFVHLNVFSMDNLIFLRFINGILGVITAIYALKWAKLFTANKLVHILTVIIITNTLMATGMFASVSYDNLANLFGAMSIYYMSLFFDKRRINILAMFLICLFAGCLSKITFLPLALILIVILLARERRSLKNLPEHLMGIFKPLCTLRLVLWLFTVVLLVFNGILYGGNLLTFHSLNPPADKVIGLKNAMQYRIFARNYIVAQFRDGKYTYEHAIEEAKHIIKHPGDRYGTVILLQAAHQQKDNKRTLMPFAHYVTQWTHAMVERAVGYVGHQSVMKNQWSMYPYYLVLIVSGTMLIRKLHWHREKGHTFSAFIIVFLYALFLLCCVNYPIYVKSNFFDLSLTGRYLFPVLVPISGLTAYYLINFFPKTIQAAIAILATYLFIYGDLIFFIKNATEPWFIK
jgi:hypothetical protein